MIKRRQINAGRRAPRTRAILAAVGDRAHGVLLAVQDRVLWRGGERLRGASDLLRWPFERVAWAFERKLAWPLSERAGSIGVSLRSAGIAALALVAAGAGVLGLTLASSGDGVTTAQAPRAPRVAALVRSAEKTAPEAPALQGSAPDFTPGTGGNAAGGGSGSPSAEEPAKATGAGSTVDATTTFSTASSSAAAKPVPAGPAAMKVARRFAGAFVLYETGKADAGVRTAFGETASPRLARALLQRPPRLPENVKVPKAKVVNVVPGPRHGDTHTLSVSLLRVGVTSELRIDVKRDEKSGDWQVTDVLG